MPDFLPTTSLPRDHFTASQNISGCDLKALYNTVTVELKSSRGAGGYFMVVFWGGPLLSKGKQNPASQGQNPALTVLHVPGLRDSGLGAAHTFVREAPRSGSLF